MTYPDQTRAISKEEIMNLLSYDPETGEFTWKYLSGSKGKWWDSRFAGKRAGSVCSTHGYRRIGINCADYRDAHLAWTFMTGEWPEEMIDHVDRDRANCRWENLRLANQSQQNANQALRSDNTSGTRGVRFRKSTGKWLARIKVDGKEKHIGVFTSKDAAAAAYRNAAIKTFGQFFNETHA